MHYSELLGQNLKSTFLKSLFETYDVQVVYSYDRSDEGTPDEFTAELPEFGIEFVFDEQQNLRTMFVAPSKLVHSEQIGIKPGEIRPFSTIAEASQYAHTTSANTTEGTADFLGEVKDWIIFERTNHTIHYEFSGGSLRLITISSISA